MRTTSSAARSSATETVRQDWRETDRFVGDVLSDIAKLVLWPQNTAPSLAAACGCSVRQAERFLGGHCELSGDAVAAIMSEILKRRGIRNIKVAVRR